MTSYRIGISGNRRAAARLVRKVHQNIRKAYESRKAKGVTQTAIAGALGVHRSVINRQLRGTEDMSVGRVAELAWALGYKANFELVAVDDNASGNRAAKAIPAASEAHVICNIRWASDRVVTETAQAKVNVERSSFQLSV